MKVELIFAPGGALPPLHEVFRPQPGGMNHNERRRAMRAEKRRRESIEIGPPVTEDQIPPGSLLSDQTLEAIRRGDYRLGVFKDPPKKKPRASRKLVRR